MSSTHRWGVFLLLAACSANPAGEDGGAGGGGGAAGGGSGGGGPVTCGSSPLDSGCTGFVPFIDADGGTMYAGHPVFLYRDGVIPVAHRIAGFQRASAVVPLDTAGNPSDAGVYILLSIGFSNVTQEFCKEMPIPGPPGACDPWTFMGQLATDPAVRGKRGLVVMNGAMGGQNTPMWDAPTEQNYGRVAANLADAGFSEAQVQVVWTKIAHASPTRSLPDPAADAYLLEIDAANAVRAMKVRYPNLKMVFISSRTYGGWSIGTHNPEPYAYEQGFAVSWLVDDQIRQMAGGGMNPDAGDLDYSTGVAPWLAWGPYFWTDGLRGRSDGLTWTQADVEPDGVHASMSGELKAATMLRVFFKTSPFTRCWFTTDGGSCP